MPLWIQRYRSNKKVFNNYISYELKKYNERKHIINELKSDQTIANSQIIIDLENAIYNEKIFYLIYSQIDTLTKIKSKA